MAMGTTTKLSTADSGFVAEAVGKYLVVYGVLQIRGNIKYVEVGRDE